MAEVRTLRPVNAGQLSHELGGVAVRVVGPDAAGSSVVRSDIAQSALDAAAAAHVANPGWVNPNPAPPPPPTPRDVAADKVTSVPAGPVKAALEAIVAAL